MGCFPSKDSSAVKGRQRARRRKKRSSDAGMMALNNSSTSVQPKRACERNSSTVKNPPHYSSDNDGVDYEASPGKVDDDGGQRAPTRIIRRVPSSSHALGAFGSTTRSCHSATTTGSTSVKSGSFNPLALSYLNSSSFCQRQQQEGSYPKPEQHVEFPATSGVDDDAEYAGSPAATIEYSAPRGQEEEEEETMMLGLPSATTRRFSLSKNTPPPTAASGDPVATNSFPAHSSVLLAAQGRTSLDFTSLSSASIFGFSEISFSSSPSRLSNHRMMSVPGDDCVEPSHPGWWTDFLPEEPAAFSVDVQELQAHFAPAPAHLENRVALWAGAPEVIIQEAGVFS